MKLTFQDVRSDTLVYHTNLTKKTSELLTYYIDLSSGFNPINIYDLSPDGLIQLQSTIEIYNITMFNEFFFQYSNTIIP